MQLFVRATLFLVHLKINLYPILSGSTFAGYLKSDDGIPMQIPHFQDFSNLHFAIFKKNEKASGKSSQFHHDPPIPSICHLGPVLGSKVHEIQSFMSETHG